MAETRQFSTKRLYTLAKWAVIAVTAFTALGTAINYHNLTQPYPCNHPVNSSEQRGCVTFYAGVNEIEQKSFDQDLTITIFLPLIFFGGVGVYRYIFPYK